MDQVVQEKILAAVSKHLNNTEVIIDVVREGKGACTRQGKILQAWDCHLPNRHDKKVVARIEKKEKVEGKLFVHIRVAGQPGRGCIVVDIRT